MSDTHSSGQSSDFSVRGRSGASASAGGKQETPVFASRNSPAGAKNYYVCSYGGSGSWMLVKFLEGFGNAFHLHSRNPPKRLTKPIDEQFGVAAVCPDECHFVVFLYARPGFSITRTASFGPAHWRNIGVPPERFPDIPRDPRHYLQLETDLIDYLGFFDNYVSGEMSYPVLAVNYHRLWDHLPQLFDALKLPLHRIETFPKKREKPNGSFSERPEIFAQIDRAIDRMPPICLIEPN